MTESICWKKFSELGVELEAARSQLRELHTQWITVCY